MKAKKLKTARELIETHPGVVIRHREYIHSILKGGVGMLSHYNTAPEAYGTFVVAIANAIIERTEQ